MNTINREQFEAWLFAQPDERQFKYIEGQPDSPTGCLACNYLRESTNQKEFSVNASRVGIRFGDYNQPYVLLDWLSQYLSKVCVFASTLPDNSSCLFTAKDAKRIYAELFPQSVPEPTLIEAKPTLTT